MVLNIQKSNSQLPVGLAELRKDALIHLENSKAENTKRAYRSDWNQFSKWCKENAVEEFPATPETVAYYMTYLGKDYKASTIKRKMASLSQRHEMSGIINPITHPVVQGVWEGLQREIGVKEKGKDALWLEELRLVVNGISSDQLSGNRNRALLLVGWAGALRRSELVNIDVENLVFTTEGFVIQITKSKTDQKSEGQDVALPYGSNPVTCPIRNLKKWLEVSQIQSGAVFRRIDRHGHVHDRLTAQSVGLVVKQACEQVGLDPQLYGAHSLRSGFCSTAAKMGKNEQQIMRQTRHKKSDSLHRYIQQAGLFEDNAAIGIGL